MGTATPTMGKAGRTLRSGGAHADRAARSDAARTAGTIGLAARGVLYAVLGVLVLRVAWGQADQSADKQGVLQEVADRSFGAALLAVLAVGLAAYALWSLARAAMVHEDSAAKAWSKRAARIGVAVVYGAAAASAVSILRGRGGSGQGGGAQQHGWTAEVLGWTGGQWLVAAVGLAFVVFAGWGVWRALSRKFLKHLETDRMSPAWERVATVSGIAGFLGRAAAATAIGWFLVKAAIEFDPSEPMGLDESLRALQSNSYGPLLLTVIAVGLVLFAVFSGVEARWREDT